jgi:hypothetical protein
MRFWGSGGARASARQALFDDGIQHYLRRAAWHLSPKRSKRDTSAFSCRLLASNSTVLQMANGRSVDSKPSYPLMF